MSLAITCPCGVSFRIRPSYAKQGRRFCSIRCRSNFTKVPSEERFWTFVFPEPNSGCWLWTGALHTGYGRFGVKQGMVRQAHRVAWEITRGPIPEGLQVDHLCRNTACVNPDHLEPVTPLVNTLRSTSLSAINARKTHCFRGHLFDDVNTLIRGGARNCRTCLDIYNAKRRNDRRRQSLGDLPDPDREDTWF
jgi:hypothetical protein